MKHAGGLPHAVALYYFIPYYGRLTSPFTTFPGFTTMSTSEARKVVSSPPPARGFNPAINYLSIMILRLHLLLLAIVFLPTEARTQSGSADWNLVINGSAVPDTLTTDWLTKQIGETPKTKPLGKHGDHQHYEYRWKKSGIRVETNQPGGTVNSIDLSFRKKQSGIRNGSSPAPLFALSVAGGWIDEQTPVSSFLGQPWNRNAGNGKNLIPTQYFVIDGGTRINAYLNASRTKLDRILITFSL